MFHLLSRRGGSIRSTVLVSSMREVLQYLMQVTPILRLALPDDQYGKACRLKGGVRFSVPLAVTEKFCQPEITIGLRRRCARTSRVAVPVTAMYEDSPPPTAIGEIRGAGQVSIPGPVSHAECGAYPPNSQLRDRTGLANAPHALRDVVGRAQASRVLHQPRFNLLEWPVLQWRSAHKFANLPS